MSTESDVQLLAEGSGPLVRTVTVTTLIDGTPTDVQMQVVAISDQDGNLLDQRIWRNRTLTALEALVVRLDELTTVCREGLHSRRSTGDSHL